MAEEPTATSPTTSRPARKQRKAGEKKVDMLFQRFMKAQKTNEDWKNQGNNFVWIPDDEKAYVVGEIVDKKGDEVLVQLENGTRKTLKQADTEPMNPPNLTKINDMAQLSYLNDASVLNNLRMRYEDDQIYTYSGLFLVAINPYKRLPIYSQETIDSLKGRRREECPPHIFAVADTAFRQMTQNHTDQSMLVTGESGAGKTENTKKIIQYLTSTASKGGVGKLEQQLLRTNPLLEAFGNAKTVRNNNSSRFGKFIQIDFGASYYIVGTKIQNYLLETTRVVAQNSEERNFHFFYQLCANPEPRQKYFLGDPRNFKYLNQSGCYTVTGVDDEKEFTETINAMSIIGLSEDEREEICAISAALLHLGNIEFTKVSAAGKDGAEIKDKTSLQHAAKFLGVEASALEVAIIHPTITAGTQVIKTHASPEQASANRNALARSIYDKMFNYIVSRINESLSSKEPPKNFIGVLDIAGFEIFETNSFEQLCINYTNERLQQFFNHHMFKKEQDEYMKEQIEWQMQDFGMDLQPTIDIIEKPNGIMATIDELAVIPGSNEKTLTAEVLKRCGPGSNFLPKGAPAIVKAEKFSPIQFTVSHYAGEVKYTTTRWIEKNTDPLSEDLKTCMRASKRKYLNKFFQPTAEERQMAAQRRGRMTISIQYRTQLKNLMTLLGGTEPHFIRCIVPNSLQKPGIIDPFNVLHQLKCNGVLEGIRIVKKGYPGRLVFKEFEKRYSLLSKKAELAGEPTSRGKCILILQSAGLVETKHYKIGQTKVFMKAGVEASLEEAREARLSQIMITVQAAMRGWLGRKDYETLKAKIAYIKILQKNWKTYYNLRDWSWWQLYQKARPEIERRQEEERRKKEREALEKLKQELKEEQENISKITQDKNSINSKIATLQVNLAASKNKQDLLQQDIKTLQGKISELEGSLRIIKDEKRLVEEDKGKFGSLLVSRDATIKQKEEEAAKLDEVLRATTRDVDAIKKNIGEKDLKGAQSDAKLKHVEEEIKNWKQKFEGESTRAKEIDRQKTAADDKIRELNAFIDMLGRQKQELENKNRQLGEDIKTKRNEIGELQSKLNQTNEEANTVKLELSKKENELKNKVKSLEDTGLDKKKSDSELVAANEKLNDEIRKRQKVETDLRHVVGDNAELDQKIQRLKEEIKNLENLIGKQRDENTQQKEKVNELSESNAQLENKRAQLERALREASLKANEDRDNDKQTINKLNTKLTDQTNDFNDQNAQLTQQRNQVDNKVRNLEKQQRDTQKQFGDLQKSKEDTEAKIKKLEGEVQDLNNQLAAERRRGSDIEDAKKNVQAEIRNNNLVIDQFKEDSAKLDTKFRKAQQELTDAQEKSSTLETERDDLLRTIDTQDRNTRQTKADLDAAKNQLNQIQVEKEKTANEVRNLSQRAIDLENQIQTLQNAQKGKGEEGSTIASELEKVSADRKNLQRKVTQLEGQQKTLQAKLEEITKKLQEENAKREQAESKLRDAETRLLAAKGAVDDATRRLKNLEQQIATAQNELNDASNNLNRLKVERRDVQAKVDEHQEQVGALEGAIESANSQIKTLQGKLNEVTSKLESEKQNRANVELETGRLRGELDRQKEAQDAESRKQKAAVEDLNQQLNAGETAFDKNQKNLQDEISDLKKELSRLQLVQPVNTVDQEAVERLRRDYEAQIVKLTAQRDEELKACNDLESRTKQQETILQDARDKLEFEEKQRKKAEMQKRQLADDLEEYREQAEEAEELREDLEKSQQEGKQAVTALKGELEKIRNQRMASEEALQSIKRENDNLKTQLEAERNKETNSSKVKSQFESELSELENLVNKAKRDKANTQKLLKKLERENRELTGKIAEQSQNKMDSDNKFSTKERELQKLKADFEFQSKIVVRYESENKGLSSEVNKFKEMCTKLEEEVSNIRSQIQRQQKKSREMERRARSATSRRGAAGDGDDDDL